VIGTGAQRSTETVVLKRKNALEGIRSELPVERLCCSYIIIAINLQRQSGNGHEPHLANS
jgi:hypothetical protein